MVVWRLFSGAMSAAMSVLMSIVSLDSAVMCAYYGLPNGIWILSTLASISLLVSGILSVIMMTGEKHSNLYLLWSYGIVGVFGLCYIYAIISSGDAMLYLLGDMSVTAYLLTWCFTCVIVQAILTVRGSSKFDKDFREEFGRNDTV